MKTTKTKSLNLLNAVNDLLVSFANDNNINLADEFESVDDFKKFVIALTFKTIVDLGFSVQEAFDATLGDGAYDDMVTKVWESAQGGAA